MDECCKSLGLSRMAIDRPSLANSAKVDASEQGSDGLTTGNMLAIPAGVIKG
ncbi:hypothetical protein LB504_002722 [Fusarium proliferatum]|nr:hypothetical protein LB504_002722 [Fusarium proliferatum]